MKLKFFTSFLALTLILIAPECRSEDTNLIFADCGAGWVLSSSTSIDGIKSETCEKLWCYDLETGKSMGAGDKANAGYVITTDPVVVESLDSEGNLTSIECFGQRKWCSGETAGVWNAKYGAYTKKGEDSNIFLSVKRGDCFSWGSTSSVVAECKDGQIPILVNGQWVCSARKSGVATSNMGTKTVAGVTSTIHRSSTVKKAK